MADEAVLDSRIDERFMALVQEAEGGSQVALDRLIGFQPELMEQIIRNGYGNLAQDILQRLLRKQAGTNLIYIEGLKSHIAHMRTGLEGPEPNLLETLLIERILLTWVQVYRADQAATDINADSIKVVEYYERRQDPTEAFSPGVQGPGSGAEVDGD